MSPLLVHLLRRVALALLVLAGLALVGPPVLRELGLVGPRPPEMIAAAEHSLAAARRYGADDAMPAVQEASRRLQEAKALLERGEGRAARGAARAASAAAIGAQREALTRREEQRRRSEAIAAEVDRLLNRLEDLYAEAREGSPRAEADRLLSVLKSARQTGAALILAHEQGNHARVIGEEAATREALAAAAEELGAPGPSGADSGAGTPKPRPGAP